MNHQNESMLLGKKNLKWFHSRIENFNNSVPYQLNAISTCKNNIRKQHRLENFTAVRHERMSAERPIRNLQQSLKDIEELRKQVVDSDVDKFDKLVSQSRERITAAVDGFNQYYDSLSLRNNCSKQTLVPGSRNNNDYGSLNSDAGSQQQQQMLDPVQEERYQNAIAEEIEKIEKDSQALNGIFKDLAQIINDQRESVDMIEDQVEQSHAHVVSAQKELAQVAAKMHGTAYPLLGAIIGSCVAGPIGFVAGLKIGTVVAVTGSVIGFSGGRVLKNRQQKAQREIMENVPEQDNVVRA